MLTCKTFVAIVNAVCKIIALLLWWWSLADDRPPYLPSPLIIIVWVCGNAQRADPSCTPLAVFSSAFPSFFPFWLDLRSGERQAGREAGRGEKKEGKKEGRKDGASARQVSGERPAAEEEEEERRRKTPFVLYSYKDSFPPPKRCRSRVRGRPASPNR